MNKDEQRAFVTELINNVKEDLLSNVKRVPEDWDGHELRQWIADRFQAASYTLKEQRSRYRAYKNAVRVHNL